VKAIDGALTLLCIQAICAGCGYTILGKSAQRESPCPGIGEASLPDLSIDDINASTHWVPGVTVENYPMIGTTFTITVRNVGSAPFDGSILLSYTDNESDMRAKRYPHHGKVSRLSLQVGDSAAIGIDCGGLCKPGTHLKFLLRTDSYYPHTYDPISYFARQPVCEESYENNVADFVVPWP